jgi:tRNA G10  N-methylase Trm11
MSQKSVFILGRQPAIGLAELESLFGSQRVEPLGDQAAIIDVTPGEVDFTRIGSSIRLCKSLDVFTATNWQQVAKQLAQELPRYLDSLPAEGKVKLGLSVFGLHVNERQLFAAGLTLKKVCKQAGRSVRLVPNTETALSSAQVLHNQLTGDMGLELLIVAHGNKTYVSQTVAVQDITAYAARDQGRPKRDARVGMLPPKLAQTIVNLGTGELPPSPDTIVLDPFCGTGVVLQEALIMGYGAYGTDLEPRMIDYSRINLEWLATHDALVKPSTSPTLEVGDATDHRWEQPFSIVAGETYLGTPLTGWPKPEKLRQIIGTCNVILEKFLRNIGSQMPSGTRLCLAVPAWKSPEGRIHHLSLLDQLEFLGYNRVRFSHVAAKEMVYYRPDAIVARELLVITRK